MKYDSEKGLYEADIYLKQGYYNYEYILLKNDGNAISTFIEGTHFETLKRLHRIHIPPTKRRAIRPINWNERIKSKGLF